MLILMEATRESNLSFRSMTSLIRFQIFIVRRMGTLYLRDRVAGNKEGLNLPTWAGSMET